MKRSSDRHSHLGSQSEGVVEVVFLTESREEFEIAAYRSFIEVCKMCRK